MNTNHGLVSIKYMTFDELTATTVFLITSRDLSANRPHSYSGLVRKEGAAWIAREFGAEWCSPAETSDRAVAATLKQHISL